MTLSDLVIRDPFVLPDKDGYYIYGTTFDASHPNSFRVYHSKDLCDIDSSDVVFQASEDFWAKKDFWAPEVYHRLGRYYMAASFKSDNRCRGTQILVSRRPTGPFRPLTDEPVTPESWECLDGTLYFEEGRCYMFFCREWLQVHDGEMYVQELSSDLKEPKGEPVKLFSAGDVKWVSSILGEGNFVTDGPFVYKDRGRYRMLWSSFSQEGYAIGLAEAESLWGPWRHKERPVYNDNGGHPMVFMKNGRRYIAFHSPNDPSGKERMQILPLEELLRND